MPSPLAIAIDDLDRGASHPAEHSQPRLQEAKDRFIVGLRIALPHHAPNLYLHLVQEAQGARIYNLRRANKRGGPRRYEVLSKGDAPQISTECLGGI